MISDWGRYRSSLCNSKDELTKNHHLIIHCDTIMQEKRVRLGAADPGNLQNNSNEVEREAQGTHRA